jgi:hypothetical protein
MVKDSNGKAGYTGSPGEQTCAGGGCHSGGSSSSKSVSITATPSFSLDEYFPDSAYTVSVTINANGFSKFGFGCEVLNTLNSNAGTLQNPGAGVKQVNLTKRNMVHTTPKSGANSATFTFKWVAPGAGSSDAIFYVCGNAVNGTGNTSGDLPIPYSYTLTEGTPPTNTLSLNKIPNNLLSGFNVYPNPSQGLSTVSYYLNQTKSIKVELFELNGKLVKELSNKIQSTGNHSEIIDLQNVAKGVYFIKTTSEGAELSQKMIVIN